MKSLDTKLANIHADPGGASDFILAAATDPDMARGLAAPGIDPISGQRRSLADFRDQVAEIVYQGLVDIVLMSVSTSEQLTVEQRLFEGSAITPAARGNDTTDVHELAGKLGARGFRVQLGKPMGRQTDRDDLTLAPRDLLTLLPALGRLAELSEQQGPRVMIGDSVGYYSQAERKLRGDRCAQGCWTGCYAGCQAIGIQSDGGVKGCLSLQPREGEADPFIEGNVRQSSLREIWTREGAFAYNRGGAQAPLRGACARCSHARLCRGGAKCVAHAYTGSMSGDPMCYLAASRAAGAGAKILPASATAAATAILMSIGCGGTVIGTGGSAGAGGGTTSSTSGAGGTTTSSSSSGGATDAGPDAADGGVDCSHVTCTVCNDCDYGVAQPNFKECCCKNACCECDYGVQPPGCCP